MRTSPATWWWLPLAALLILLSLPARLVLLPAPLWLDEAWVANSVAAPSLREMFYYSTWLQTTPPLLLLIERIVTGVAGESELALRLFPVAAGLAALVFTIWSLRTLFPPLAATIGATLLIANYWAVRYPQQVKQYGSDLLVAALLAYLLAAYWTRSFRRRELWLLTAAGALGFFLSFPAIFFVPSILISIAAGAIRTPTLRLRSAIAALLIAAASAANFAFFILPNQAPLIFKSRSQGFLDLHRPLASVRDLFLNYSDLFAPGRHAILYCASGALLAVAALGALRSLSLARRREPVGVAVTLAALTPVAAMLAASLLRQYPVLLFPRLILWTLPCVALAVACGVQAMAAVLERYPNRQRQAAAAVAFACIGAVIALNIVVIRYPRPIEQNAAAVALLKKRMAASDCLYLHGGMWEQFQYYARRSAWSPRCVHVGGLPWPCCALNVRERRSSPKADGIGAELLRAAARAKGNRLWFLLPSASRGHWSSSQREEIGTIPSAIRSACLAEVNEPFDQTLVLGFRCP